MACTDKIFQYLLLFFLSFVVPGLAFCQAIEKGNGLESALIITFILLLLISLAIFLAAIYSLLLLRKVLNNELSRSGLKVRRGKSNFFRSLSRSLTRSVPVEQEKGILLDHDYDGIRELDNHLPPWWKGLFYFTIIWGLVYLLTYHVFNFLPTSDEEFKRELASAEEELKSRQLFVKESLDEHTVEFSDDPDILENGETIFMTNCVVCHAEDGGGGIGPNLTDDYWLHGGSVKNIFWVIKYGVPAKGMISWLGQLSPTDIRDVASYLLTLRGTTPSNPKEPQGEYYNEDVMIGNPEDTPDITDNRPSIDEVRDTLDNIQIGRGLFSGSIRLNNGGPGCITCHHITEGSLPQGALLAPDLTNVFTRLESDYIVKVATQPYHPTMQEAYRNRPVLIEDVEYLMSFFEYVGTSTTHQQERDERAAGFLNRIKKQ